MTPFKISHIIIFKKNLNTFKRHQKSFLMAIGQISSINILYLILIFFFLIFKSKSFFIAICQISPSNFTSINILYLILN